MKIKIAITGGHLTPALSVIQKLQKRKKFEIYYIGRKYPLEGDRTNSLEYSVIQKLGIPFYSLIPARLQRSFTFFTLFSLWKFPLAFLQSLYYLLRIRPHLVMSFCGYISLPVCLWASFLRIPFIIHEQTYILGLANRLVLKKAKYLCLTWKETQFREGSEKEIVTGNPNLFEHHFIGNRDKSTTNFGDLKLPLIYITGGSLGSQFINNLVREIIGELSDKFRILHQTGAADNGCDFLLLNRIRKMLSSYSQNNYKIVKFIDPYDIISIFKDTSFIVGRAGANTVFEMQRSGVPGILIPLPYAADDEQRKNAYRLAELGCAVVLEQEDTGVRQLREACDYLWENFETFKKKAEVAKKNLPQNASERIVRLIESCF